MKYSLRIFVDTYGELVFVWMFFNLAPLREHPRRFFDTAVRLSEPDNEGEVTEAWMQEASDLVKTIILRVLP